MATKQPNTKNQVEECIELGQGKIASVITWTELEDFLRANPERKGVVVFKQHPKWDRQYDEFERSYWLNGSGNHFQDGKISNSIWGYCLDSNSPDADGIRLDWVIYGLPEDRWEIDYCYILPDGK